MAQQVALIKDEILSGNYFTLHNIAYDLTRRGDGVIRHKREIYGRGNGATILLYSARKKTMVLIRQLRAAIWVNGNESGQLIGTYAGLLDNDEPEVHIHREAVEEAGYEVDEMRRLFELYISPSGMTELIRFSVAEHSNNQCANAGGGVENENTEMLELPSSQVLEMTKIDEVRDGKMVLLFNYL